MTVVQALAGLGAARLSLILKPMITEECFVRYSRILMPDIRADSLNQMELTCQIILEEQAEKNPAAGQIKKLWGNNKITRVAIELAFLLYLDSSVHDLLSIVSGRYPKNITVELGALIAWPDKELCDMAGDMKRAYEDLRHILLLESQEGDISFRPFYADTGLVAGLTDGTGRQGISGDFSFFTGRDCRQESILYKEEIQMLGEKLMRRHADGLTPVLLHITGEEGAGKKFLARHICSQMGLNCLLLKTKPMEEDKWESYCQKLGREHKNPGFFGFR